jgi:integrase
MRYTFEKTGHGLTDNLGAQLQRITRNLNEGKFSTRYTYLSHMEEFSSFVAEEFRLQKLANIKDKHLEAFVKREKEKGNADKTIKNKLSAIRYFHNCIPEAKYQLEESKGFNAKVGLKSTPNITDVDRSWAEQEFNDFRALAINLGRGAIVDALDVMLHLGLRIDEAVTLQHHHLRDALRNDRLHIHRITKGKVPRNIPLTEESRKILERIHATTAPGEYAITPKKYVEKNKIHNFKKSIQNFINYHRQKIQLPERELSAHNVESNMKAALTCHGTRHTFTRLLYQRLREKGYSEEQAKIEVSHQLGHSRKKITDVYLAHLG